jgi:hypothetical protein
MFFAQALHNGSPDFMLAVLALLAALFVGIGPQMDPAVPLSGPTSNAKPPPLRRFHEVALTGRHLNREVGHQIDALHRGLR